MAVEWVLKPEDVARIRFAFSPVWELVASLRSLRDPARQAIHLPWIKAVRSRLPAVDLAELLTLVPPTGYIPDFLTPPPETPLPVFAAELERVRRTPPLTAAYEVGQVKAADRGLVESFLADPAAGVARVADTLQSYWDTCFAEFWPTVHGLLERDVLRRSRTLVTGGAHELFATLDPSVELTGNRLLIDKPWCHPAQMHGDGLILVPSAFHWPTVAVISAPYQSVLIYPVQGVGTLWDQGPPPAPDALAALIGKTKAQILTAIAEPATTTALSKRMSLTTGAISQHLGTLSGGGLAARRRVGKEVYYHRTATGDALAGGGVPGGAG